MEHIVFSSIHKNNLNPDNISAENSNDFSSFAKIPINHDHDPLSSSNLVSQFNTSLDHESADNTCPGLLTNLDKIDYPNDHLSHLSQSNFDTNGSSNNYNNSSINNMDYISIDPNTNVNINLNIDESQLTEDERRMRKRAQNRAAQKAFRERKANRMKELEEKLMESERSRQMLLKEIDDLKKLNMEINVENRILLQNTKKFKNPLNSPDELSLDDSNMNSNSNFTFPTKEEFYETMVIDTIKNNKVNKTFKHIDGTFNEQSLIKQNTQFTNEIGQQFLTVPATWNYLSKVSKTEDFDMYFVMQSLRGNEVCDEHGPSYPKVLIDELVAKASEK